MTIEIFMPALSPTMTHGNLIKWHKKEGATVESGDLLAEIETDKATMEVEAVDEGVLGEILVSEGSQNVPVNTVIAVILEEGEDKEKLNNYKPSNLKPSNKEETISTTSITPQPVILATSVGIAPNSSSPSVEKLDRIFASPLARRLAEENTLDLKSIKGSGPRGRIVKSDVENFIKSGNTASEMGFGFPRTFSNVTGNGSYHDEPLSQMRKIISQRLLKSKQEIPHFYASMDCMMDELLKARKTLNEKLDKAQKISINDFIIKACALALKDVPKANAAWLGESIRYYNNADISIAVSVDNGLITPIIKAAELKSLFQISAESKNLIKKARENKLAPEEFQGGSFSISNMGMYNIKQFNAIINQPQACIISIGAAKEGPIVVDGKLKIATQMTSTISADHRVVDGIVAAEFLVAFKKYIENPLLLVLA